MATFKILECKSATTPRAWFAYLLLVVVVFLGNQAAMASTGHDDIVSLRRLTQEQYRQTIADIFGDDIEISARLEPDPRREGLIAIGTAQASVSASGFEQYDAAARQIAEQVTDLAHRELLIGCKPVNTQAADDRCARTFFSRAGRFLYRRALNEAELERFVGIARKGAKVGKDFYWGLSLSLSAMLETAPFLFRVERATWQGDGYRLDDYSTASRISFLIWNAPPDEALLSAAENGSLRTDNGLHREIDRLLASPRYEKGVRAFFNDMLALDDLLALQKDPTIYPRYSAKLASDAREQTLRTIVDTLLRRDQDYRAVFTTRHTFFSRALGFLYSEPVTSPSGWEARELAAGDPRAGILAQPAFLMAHSHPGRSSPTLRGKALRELILCQSVPAPPPNVDFALVQNVSDPNFATARQRLTAHNTEPMCVACHKLMDPLGLPLESFDGAAGMRMTENGAEIDLSGSLHNQSFIGAAGLGATLAKDGAAASCLINRLYSYGAGRAPEQQDSERIDAIYEQYAERGFNLTKLLRTIALSREFYSPPPVEISADQVAIQQGDKS
ncbi:DUF1592 domain-containing protein [Zhongshania sp.]|uniref:DUF1592 domain-containing protein n=1 Tax=Zhongshania sp. TaxID=1971902 RepID=UPI0035660355